MIDVDTGAQCVDLQLGAGWRLNRAAVLIPANVRAICICHIASQGLWAICPGLWRSQILSKGRQG